MNPVEFSYTEPSSGWIVVAWHPAMARGSCYGPFRNETDAKKWGRANFPKQYVIGSLTHPDTYAWHRHLRTCEDTGDEQ